MEEGDAPYELLPADKRLTEEQRSDTNFIMSKIKQFSERIKRVETAGERIGMREQWLGPSRFLDRAIADMDVTVALVALDERKSDIHTYLHKSVLEKKPKGKIRM